jgi:lipoprotein signal peptidase
MLAGAAASAVGGRRPTAAGNLYDRVRWERGVVDFIGPIDLGLWNFPIFNVADMAITCGAVLLAVSFWFEEQAERARVAGAAPSDEDLGRESPS